VATGLTLSVALRVSFVRPLWTDTLYTHGTV